MATPTLGLLNRDRRDNWIRLRTLTTLRWVGVSGQLAAVLLAKGVAGIDVLLWPCIAVIAASAAVNTYLTLAFPPNTRLSENQVTAQLLFDILQLGLLLYVTGGLTNPFAILFLLPVIMSATVLEVWATLLLGLLSVAAITFLSSFHIPLRFESGELLAPPQTFLAGFWIAILTGLFVISAFAQRITAEVRAMSEALTATQMALEREQRLTSLGGVVAAAAHELGTPLATIKLISSELLDEVKPGTPEAEDLKMITEQANRCRDILRSMGRHGNEDTYVRHAPIVSVVEEAGEPHTGRGISVQYSVNPRGSGEMRQPLVRRTPEIIHGLRNLIENAVDYADSAVFVEVAWSDRRIDVQISDDGPGIPAHILNRIGEPFVRRKILAPLGVQAPTEGLGLGLFIAKTLLQRSGAELNFANASDVAAERRQRGAVVSVSWPITSLAVDASQRVEGELA